MGLQCMVGVEMIQEFYYGTSWKWPIQYLPRVMITASYLDARKKKVEIEKPYMVDRGVGKEFSSLTKNPIISVHRYAELLRRQQPQIASTFDYPCEPDLRKKRGYTCIEAPKEKINMILNHLKQTGRIWEPFLSVFRVLWGVP